MRTTAYVVDVVGDEAGRRVLERLAAVGRAPHTADFKARKHEIGIAGSNGDAGDARLITAGQVSGSGASRAPRYRAVGRAENTRRAGAGKDQVRIVRRARDRPHRCTGRPSPRGDGSISRSRCRAGRCRNRCRREVRPAVRMGRERPHARLGVHSRRAPETLQRFAEVIAVPDGESCRPDIKTRRHGRLPVERGIVLVAADLCVRPMMNPAGIRRQCSRAGRSGDNLRARRCCHPGRALRAGLRASATRLWRTHGPHETQTIPIRSSVAHGSRIAAGRRLPRMTDSPSSPACPRRRNNSPSSCRASP